MQIDQVVPVDKRYPSIYVNGKDKTAQISDWQLWWGDKSDELMVTCRFPSGKSYSCPLSECEIFPTEVAQGKFLVRKGSAVFRTVERVVIYGGKYAVVQYPGNAKGYVVPAEDIAFMREASFKH